MYLRQTFTITERETQLSVVKDVGWGCLFGVDDGIPIASHLPFMVVGDRGHERLEGHMSRANPHWKTFSSDEELLAVFQGPHTYVTPSLSRAKNALPTWNYVAVHVYGRPTIVSEPEQVRALIGRLVEYREAEYDIPWRLDGLDEDWVANRLKGIVAFDMPIERMEATFRLMQNRALEDRERVAVALESTDDTNSQDVAALMRRHSFDDAD